MLGAFQSEDVLMVDFVTTYDSHQDFPDSSVILVSFGSSALFDPASPVIPGSTEMEAERNQAFEGDSISGYLGMVQSLPSNNVFATTLQIFLYVLLPPTDGEESGKREGISGVGVAAASFAALFGSLLIVATLYRRRRKQRRHEASNKFLNDIKEIDAQSDGMTMTNSSSGDCSLGTTDLGEIERIEVTLCECEEDMENLSESVLERAEEEIVFQKEKAFLFPEDSEGGIQSEGDRNYDSTKEGEPEPLRKSSSKMDGEEDSSFEKS
ncbi:MAG: hypothetical protein SGARI_002309 [Bacillariaceae sp.]